MRRSTIVVLAVLVIGLAGGLWTATCFLRKRNQDALAALPSPSPTPRLNAAVSWNLAGVAIKNIDPEKRILRNVVVKLNMGTLGSHDGESGAGDIKAGETVTISFFSFVGDDRKRFKITETDLESVFVRGELEPGVRSVGLFICSRGQSCDRAADGGK